MSKIGKVDLSILKRLVVELESALATADNVVENVSPDLTQHIVELSKAAGLCMGITQEASLLVFDVHALIRNSQSPKEKTGNLIDSFLDSLKGTNNGGSQN